MIILKVILGTLVYSGLMIRYVADYVLNEIYTMGIKFQEALNQPVDFER